MKGSYNSLDPYIEVSTALLCDVQRLHDGSYNKSALDSDIKTVRSRCSEEGISFLTKTLPSLGKRLDQTLASGTKFELEGLRFQCRQNSKLPKFLGELFGLVFDDEGIILPRPSVLSVKCLRQILYLCYKLELPSAPELNQSVLQEFERTDAALLEWNDVFRKWNAFIDERSLVPKYKYHLEVELRAWKEELRYCEATLGTLKRVLIRQINQAQTAMSRCEMYAELNDLPQMSKAECEKADCLSNVQFYESLVDSYSRDVTRLQLRVEDAAGRLRWVRVLFGARKLLHQLFRTFDPGDIVPNHGPGAVSTREQLQGKWRWTHIPDRLAAVYPIDEYFFVNKEHVADRLQTLLRIGDKETPARICLVPKDSRGPRVISCEPLEFQWIQQGLRRAVYQLVEHHPLTRDYVRFTDQAPNMFGALLGSSTGLYATLDLKEASDRVCLELVRALFPAHLVRAAEACRSQETQLPGGRTVKLQKFAPMGSALCFPFLALTIWSILRAGFTDAEQVAGIKPSKDDPNPNLFYVYGDDVIVPTAKAADAITLLESFGLVVNRDKSCMGLGPSFRESCGMDAFRGVAVTPVRLRTAWTYHQHPSSYESYVEYANAFYKRGFYHTHEKIVSLLFHKYGPLADADWNLPVPSVIGLPESYRSNKRRYHSDVAIAEQRFERRVLAVIPRKTKRPVDGWMMLLRYLVSKGTSEESDKDFVRRGLSPIVERIMGLTNDKPRRCGVGNLEDGLSSPFSASSYTKRSSQELRWTWC